jgi:antitoxin (DNA-binding transcriptional repressor) of toxin-antitoxin stability system
MTLVNMREGRSQLGRLVDRALRGEEVILARKGKAVVRLVAVQEKSLPERRPGAWKGRVWMAPDFDETPEDIVRAFEGEED